MNVSEFLPRWMQAGLLGAIYLAYDQGHRFDKAQKS